MKKKALLLCALSMALFACNQSDKTAEENVTEEMVSDDAEGQVLDASYFWTTEADEAGNINIRKSRPITSDSLNQETMVEYINSIYPDVKLVTKKQSNDTLYIDVQNSRYLTNQMGSTGARLYLQEATYNLTEVKGVHYVHFEFPEGDHAAPGVYSRSKFVQEETSNH